MADVIADVTAVGTVACKKRFSGFRRRMREKAEAAWPRSGRGWWGRERFLEVKT
jgi:hypothetical protein